MDKAGLQQSIEAIIQVFIRISQSFDDDFEKLSNFWALNDGSNFWDGTERCLVNLFMRIIENFSQSLDDVGKEAQNLLWGTVSHISHSFNRGKFGSPIISWDSFEEHGDNLLDGIVAEIPDYLLVGGICTISDLRTLISNASKNVRYDPFKIWLKSFTLWIR